MKKNDQNQGWKHFKGDTIGVIVEDPTGSIPREEVNDEKPLKAPKKGTLASLTQRIVRKLVIIIIISMTVPIIAGLSIMYYSTARDTPLLLNEDRLALYNGSLYLRGKESIILADDQKGFVEMVSYLNLDKQMLVTARALGIYRYFAFIWVPKLNSFEGAKGFIDLNCDRQYTPMIVDGNLIIPKCFKKILTDKMAPMSPSQSKGSSDIES